jgi:hypothetical protein
LLYAFFAMIFAFFCINLALELWEIRYEYYI